MSDTGNLFGPDLSDQPTLELPDPGDPVDTAAWQFVNRWVLLEHQRPSALRELRAWIADAQARGLSLSPPADAPGEGDELHTGDDDVVDASTAVISALNDIVEELEGIDRAACIAALDLAQGALDDMRIVDAAVVAAARERQ